MSFSEYGWLRAGHTTRFWGWSCWECGFWCSTAILIGSGGPSDHGLWICGYGSNPGRVSEWIWAVQQPKHWEILSPWAFLTSEGLPAKAKEHDLGFCRGDEVCQAIATSGIIFTVLMHNHKWFNIYREVENILQSSGNIVSPDEAEGQVSSALSPHT